MHVSEGDSFVPQAASAGKQRYTLRHIWHAASTERTFNYVFWLHVLLDIMMESFMRFFGYLLVTVAIFLITTIAFFGFVVVLPAIGRDNQWWFYFNFFWGNYYCSYMNY